MQSRDARLEEAASTTETGLLGDLGVWLVLAAFGPYILKAQGLRTDQLVIYLAGVYGAMRLMASTLHVMRPLRMVILFFGLSAAWVMTVTVVTPIYSADTMQVIEDADHYLRPMMIALGLAAWIAPSVRARASSSLRRVCTLILALLAANALVIVVSLFVDIGGVFEPFRPAGNLLGHFNVADLSAQLGRYTGVFNQPFTAGVAYSLGLFVWSYFYVGKRALKPRALAHSVLALMLVGGVLSASKAFFLGGLPIFLVYWIVAGGLVSMMSPRVIPVVILAVVGFAVVLAHWNGVDFIRTQVERLDSGDSGLAASLSAGRYGAGGLISTQLESVAKEAPLTGLGLASFNPLDSAYLMFLIHGGVPLLVGYLWFLAWLVASGVRLAGQSQEGRLVVLVALYVVGAGLGAPVASIVRASTLLWVLVVLAIASATASRAPDLPIQSATSRRLRHAIT